MIPIDKIAQYKIPTHSYLAAVNWLNNHDDLTGEEYRVRIIELTNKGDNLDDRMSKYVYLYCVQEYIRSPGSYLMMNKLYNIAVAKAKQFIDNNPWTFAEEETISTNRKRKGPSKKERTCALWNKYKDAGWTRKQWIEKLVEEVDLTPAGASTYYAKLKKETFGC